MSELEQKLRQEVQEAPWDALKPHSPRTLYVSMDADLVSIGMDIALDHKEKVIQYLSSGLLQRLTEEQSRIWTDDRKFRFLIIQPYVLIQDLE